MDDERKRRQREELVRRVSSVWRPDLALSPQHMLKVLSVLGNSAISPFDGRSKSLTPKTFSPKGSANGWVSLSVCCSNGIPSQDSSATTYGPPLLQLGSPTEPLTFFGIDHGINLHQEKVKPSIAVAIKIKGKDVAARRKVAFALSGPSDPIAVIANKLEEIIIPMWDTAVKGQHENLSDEKFVTHAVRRSEKSGNYSLSTKLELSDDVISIDPELRKIVTERREANEAADEEAAKKAGTPYRKRAKKTSGIVPEICTEITNDKVFKTEPLYDVRDYISQPDAKEGETKAFHAFCVIAVKGACTGQAQNHGVMLYHTRFVIVPDHLMPKQLDIAPADVKSIDDESAALLDTMDDGDADDSTTTVSTNTDEPSDAPDSHAPTAPPSLVEADDSLPPRANDGKRSNDGASDPDQSSNKRVLPIQSESADDDEEELQDLALQPLAHQATTGETS